MGDEVEGVGIRIEKGDTGDVTACFRDGKFVFVVRLGRAVARKGIWEHCSGEEAVKFSVVWEFVGGLQA